MSQFFLKWTCETLRACVLFLCLLPAGCGETGAPEGVIATVNDEPIYLHTVQAMLDGRSFALGTLPRLSLETLKNHYGEALGTLIVYTLVRQELQRLHIPVSEPALDKELADIRADYGDGAFSRFLADASLDEIDWRNLLRDHLSMISFEKHVLLPEIRIQLPRVRAYYNEHLAQFQIPATQTVCFVSSEDRDKAAAFCGVFSGVGKPPACPSVQCLAVLNDELPCLWKEDVQKLAPGSCAPLRQEEGTWRSVCLAERTAAHILEISAAYPLIERILLEQEKKELFDRWLENSLAAATVKVSSHISQALSAASSSPKAQPSYPIEDEDIRPDTAPAQETDSDTPPNAP
ncbi:MAG: SurA N-terminal domain-containing protein [Desulfovibrio sp.]|jgi:hypothetical protein|nr:SurA N-terminal domain-containing protein [Desulfovibrio sp.]